MGADVAWPPILKAIFRFLSFFNLDMDVAAPECLVPDFDYRVKFFLTLLLPVFIAIVLGCVYIGHIIFQKVFLNRRKGDTYFISKLVGTFMLLQYYMFLMTTRRALAVMEGYADVEILTTYLCSCCRMQLWHSSSTPLAIRFGFTMSFDAERGAPSLNRIKSCEQQVLVIHLTRIHMHSTSVSVITKCTTILSPERRIGSSSSLGGKQALQLPASCSGKILAFSSLSFFSSCL